MSKLITSFVFIFAFGAYSFFQYFSAHSSLDSNIATATDTSAAVSSVPVSATPASQHVAVVPTLTPVKGKSIYTDGTYTGSVTDAYYGNIQVKATVTNGKLVNVTFLQYPNDRDESRYINSQAMPILKSEAIRAQSANVSGVTGASDTSAAFRESLAIALSEAKA